MVMASAFVVELTTWMFCLLIIFMVMAPQTERNAEAAVVTFIVY
jgi:biopolymer transport protein ExbD